MAIMVATATNAARKPVYTYDKAATLFGRIGGGRQRQAYVVNMIFSGRHVLTADRSEPRTEIYRIDTTECYNFCYPENSVSGFFDKVLFDECTFSGLGLKLRSCTFVNVTFKDCTFDDVWFTDLYLQDVVVVSNHFKGARWSEDSRQCFIIDDISLHTIFPKPSRQIKVGNDGPPDEVTDLAWLAGRVSLLDGSQVRSDEKLARQLAEEEEKNDRGLAAEKRRQDAKLEAKEREKARRACEQRNHTKASVPDYLSWKKEDGMYMSENDPDADLAWVNGAKDTRSRAFMTKTEREMGKVAKGGKGSTFVTAPSNVLAESSTSTSSPDLTAPSNIDSSPELDKKFPAMMPSNSGTACLPRVLAIEKAAANPTIAVAAPASRGTKSFLPPHRTNGKERRGLRIPSGAPSMYHAEAKVNWEREKKLDGDSDSDDENGMDLLQLD